MRDLTSPSSSHRFDEPYLSDQSPDSSEDEASETVARPQTTYSIPGNQPVRSPPPSTPAHESLTTVNAQACSDPVITNGHSHLISPIMASHMNPFQELVLRQQKNEQIDGNTSSDSGSHEMSPAIASLPPVSSPVDVRSLLAHESNRLDTFKKHNRETFAHIKVAHLAYVGFFLNAEGTVIQCPWCEVHLSEQQFEDITRTRPSVARSAISDEPWTPMRVHRHANGLIMDRNHPWCTWVRREAGGLYPNVTMVGKLCSLRQIEPFLSLAVRKSNALSRISFLWKF